MAQENTIAGVCGLSGAGQSGCEQGPDHGNNHLYEKSCSKNDYLGHGGATEFCNHSFNNQLEQYNSLSILSID